MGFFSSLLIVAGAYLLLGAIDWSDAGARAGWLWLVLFFVILTLGELFILPTGLGLFARLAPVGQGATTVAAWFLTIFSGSLFAGIVGTLWGRVSHADYFLLLAALSFLAAVLLRSADPLWHRVERDQAAAIENL